MSETLEQYSKGKWEREGHTSLPFKKVVTQKAYSIELSMHDFCAMSDYDTNEGHLEDEVKHFDEMLKLYGAIDVDYSGYFGAYIFFNMETADDYKEHWDMIEEIFTTYIKLAHEWVERQDD